MLSNHGLELEDWAHLLLTEDLYKPAFLDLEITLILQCYYKYG